MDTDFEQEKTEKTEGLLPKPKEAEEDDPPSLGDSARQEGKEVRLRGPAIVKSTKAGQARTRRRTVRDAVESVLTA